MKLKLKEISKLFLAFHTETGKQICLEYLKAGFVNPDCITKEIDGTLAEPKADLFERAKGARELAEGLCIGIVPEDRGKEIVKFAEDEAKPYLLRLDYKTLWSAYEGDKQHQLRNAGLV